MLSTKRLIGSCLIFIILPFAIVRVGTSPPDPATTMPKMGPYETEDFFKASSASTAIGNISKGFVIVPAGQSSTFTGVVGKQFDCATLKKDVKNSECKVEDGKKVCTKKDVTCKNPKTTTPASGNTAAVTECMACDVVEHETAASVTVDCSSTYADHYEDMARQYEGLMQEKHILLKLKNDATDGKDFINAHLALSHRPMTGEPHDIYCMGVKYTGTIPDTTKVNVLAMEGVVAPSGLSGGIIAVIVLVSVGGSGGVFVVIYFLVKKKGAAARRASEGYDTE